MIYIKNDTNLITIPRYLSSNPTTLKMSLVNNLTHQEIEVKINDFYLFSFTYNVYIDPLNIVDGEYTYRLLDEEDELLSHGLLTFGDYKREIKAYEKISNKKIQYNR